MKIYLSSVTAGRYGGFLNGNLRYLDSLIQSELDKSGFKASFEELRLTLSYPPMYIFPGIVGMEIDFKKWHDALPVSKFSRKYKKIEITLKAPEFSEYFDKAEQSKYKHKFEIENQYKNINEEELACILIDKYLEAGQMIADKLNKDDIFDIDIFEKIFYSIKQKISVSFLREMHEKISVESDKGRIEALQLERTERKKLNQPKDVLIRDIRLFFVYEVPKKLFYLKRYAEIVLQLLIDKEFKCPQYHHLYISIANTKAEALMRGGGAENWYTYGIAVLKEESLLKAKPTEQQSLVLKALEDGLLDIADLDNLDEEKIIEAVNEARSIGILGELIFKKKENRKITFVISTKGIFEKNKEEIYFTIINKETAKTVKWKFGEADAYTIDGWFGSINVTNKTIKTKPRAHMDLVLKGKQKCIQIDVERELSKSE